MNNAHIPLAERMRPTTLNNVVGQEHVLSKNGLLPAIIKNKKPVSLLLWGPPGSGKTTIARIIATDLKADFIELSAVTAGLADVKKVISHAQANRRLGMQTVLFVDEIHRFNKAQQDAFLPHVESGLLILIGATTENPSFEVITPLLSRMKVIQLQPLNETAIKQIIQKATRFLGAKKPLSTNAMRSIVNFSGGDARVALGILELAYSLDTTISEESITTAAQKKIPNYDKNGEQHFATISAFIKSMRASDVSASLYYLERMLQAGEDPKFIARRMIIFASEDIGIAASPALNLAVSTFLAVERIGMPECEYALYHCAVVLAGAKKSRVIADAMHKVKPIVQKSMHSPIPLHLRNAPTKLMQDAGYGKDYKWQPNFKHKKGNLPNGVDRFDIF